MQIPPVLTAGARIGLVATARKISPAEVAPAIDHLSAAGFKVVPGKHLFSTSHQFAGTDRERLSDFQSMADDDSIDAILVARGGYGSVRLLDALDLHNLKKRPKYVIGFSDITALHCHLTAVAKIACMHATMPVNMVQNPNIEQINSIQYLIDALLGKPISYSLSPHDLDRTGTMSGVLTGGNLSVLYSLNGSKSMPDTRNKILFLEDVDEYLYHIDRMMMNLDRSGHLAGLAGMIIGGMTSMNDNAVPYGASAEEIIRERVDRYDFPVKFGFPAGHQALNLPLVFGVEGQIQMANNAWVFNQQAYQTKR